MNQQKAFNTQYQWIHTKCSYFLKCMRRLHHILKHFPKRNHFLYFHSIILENIQNMYMYNGEMGVFGIQSRRCRYESYLICITQLNQYLGNINVTKTFILQKVTQSIYIHVKIWKDYLYLHWQRKLCLCKCFKRWMTWNVK